MASDERVGVKKKFNNIHRQRDDRRIHIQRGEQNLLEPDPEHSYLKDGGDGYDVQSIVFDDGVNDLCGEDEEHTPIDYELENLGGNWRYGVRLSSGTHLRLG